MLLFAYGSHACPYGDWSKEEKLTYVGGLFSCSLQVNFSSVFLFGILNLQREGVHKDSQVRFLRHMDKKHLKRTYALFHSFLIHSRL